MNNIPTFGIPFLAAIAEVNQDIWASQSFLSFYLALGQNSSRKAPYPVYRAPQKQMTYVYAFAHIEHPPSSHCGRVCFRLLFFFWPGEWMRFEFIDVTYSNCDLNSVLCREDVIEHNFYLLLIEGQKKNCLKGKHAPLFDSGPFFNFP